jgi:hypothetical protein
VSTWWIDNVRSARYQRAKTTASATAKTTVVVSSGTPALSVRLSLTRVPTMLISATASQYTPGRYARVRNCTARTTASSALINTDTPVRPRPALSFSRSAAVSPTVVHSTLITQK